MVYTVVIEMNLKHLLFALFIVFFVFAAVNVASAVDNDTNIVDDNQYDVSTPEIDADQSNSEVSQSDIGTTQSDIDISQSYEPSTVYKGDIINVYLYVRNNGNSTIDNLIIFYNVPQEFEILICPAEYDNGKVIIDSLNPGELIKYTFICKALVANITAIFEASLNGSSFIPLDVYVQPDNDNQSNQSGINGGVNKINTNSVNLQPAGNPLALLLLGLLSIPLFIYKRH